MASTSIAPARRASRLADVRAYLELHIEQGPVLESAGLAVGTVLGTFGVERHRVVFTGQAAHSGSTPMPIRRDSFLAAARFALAARDGAVRHARRRHDRRGRVHAGRRHRHPGSDVRAARPAPPRRRPSSPPCSPRRSASADEAAAAERCTVEWERIWQIAPIPFDQDLIAAARSACQSVSGTDHALPSGPLHDAAEMARLVPTVMIFSSSTNGISHAKEEDTPVEHLELAIRAYAQTVGHAIDRVAAG